MKEKTMIQYVGSANLLMEKREYTDAFILLYMRFERQCRKLFVWLLVHHYGIRFSLVEKLLSGGKWGAEKFIQGFDKLSTRGNFEKIVISSGGLSLDEFKMLKRKFLQAEIREHRGKIVHGSLTGERLESERLADYCKDLVGWLNAVAAAMGAIYGYDGVSPLKDTITRKTKSNKLSIRSSKDLAAFLAQKPDDIRQQWQE